MDIGQILNEQFHLGGVHALFSQNGKWFHHLKRFPGVLCDPNGYVVFATRDQYVNAGGLHHGKDLNVPRGIASLGEYTRFPSPVKLSGRRKIATHALAPVISSIQTQQARQNVLDTLASGCQTFSSTVGWQGGNLQCDVVWNPQARFWFTPDVLPDRDRWIIFFGLDDPQNKPRLNIVCEINVPKDNFNRRCAGVFLRDETDHAIYLAHNGKFGGGRTGIGKSNFRNSYPQGAWEKIQWPDGKKTEVIVIGRVDSDRFHCKHPKRQIPVALFKSSDSFVQ